MTSATAWPQGIRFGRPPFAQRFGGDHICRDRHDLGRQFRDQTAEIGIAGQHQMPSPHRTGGGMRGWFGTRLDPQHPGALEDARTRFRRGPPQADGVVQRMKLTAAAVEQPADIGVGRDHGPDLRPVQQARLAIAVVIAPFRLHIAEAGHLALLEGRHDVAPAQVAVDPVAGYPVPQDGLGLLAQLPQQARVVLADPAGHGAHGGVIGRDDLAAVPSRCPPADLLRFQHDDVIAPLRQMQSG